MNCSSQVALFKQAMQTDGNSGFHFLLKWLMMLLSFLMLLFADIANTGAKGLYMLSLFASTNIFFVTVATVSLFCTSVSEEKEHNTLGVLLMTGISPFGFLTGKLVSRLYIVLQLVLLQIPLIVIARTFGGLSMFQLMAHLVYFFAIIVVMSQVGMFFSIICQRSSSAIGFTVVFLSLLSVLPCNDTSTFLAYYFKIFETAFAGDILSQPVLLLLGFAMSIFILSLMIFNKFSFGEDSTKLSRELSMTGVKKRARYKSNPVFEKDFRYYAGGLKVLIIRVIAALFLMLYSYFSKHEFREYVYIFTIVWFYCECFYYAQVMLKAEKSGKTLSSLAMLPVPSKKVLNQKFKAFAVSVAPAALTFLFLCYDFS